MDKKIIGIQFGGEMKKSLITLATTGVFNSASTNTNAQAPMSGGGKLTEKYYILQSIYLPL